MWTSGEPTAGAAMVHRDGLEPAPGANQLGIIVDSRRP